MNQEIRLQVGNKTITFTYEVQTNKMYITIQTGDYSYTVELTNEDGRELYRAIKNATSTEWMLRVDEPYTLKRETHDITVITLGYQCVIDFRHIDLDEKIHIRLETLQTELFLNALSLMTHYIEKEMYNL